MLKVVHRYIKKFWVFFSVVVEKSTAQKRVAHVRISRFRLMIEHVFVRYVSVDRKFTRFFLKKKEMKRREIEMLFAIQINFKEVNETILTAIATETATASQ